ncbi:MAG: universal stress protein [Actinobacteria bacterium]|nr:MAG: universal stress protein [Actinomycetota bacterium]
MPETESMPTEGRAAPAVPIFGNILCAISGKEGGFAAVEQAAALAGTQGHLTFLAVTSFRSGGAHRGPAIGPGRATEILERAEGIAREAGVPYTSEVDPGTPPARVIMDWSARYDLLAIGAPASSWPAKLLSVGVGDKALGGFSTALLVARPLEVERRIGDRVVVASDGLEASHALIDLAGRLAHTSGSNVTLVHALGRESPIKRGRPREQERTLQEQERTLERTRASGTTELLVKPGRAGVVVVSTATAADASLVVMGSRRLEGLRAMGSVSRRVVHQARCSVLLVPPETLAR